MPILVSCECGEQFRDHDACAGRQARCPGCGRVLVIPTPGAKAGPVEEIAWCEPRPSRFNCIKAVASAILGLVSIPGSVMIEPVIVSGFVAGILAILLGRSARRKLDASRDAVTGRMLARSGIIMGWAGLGCSLMVMLLAPIYSGSNGLSRRAQCINNLKQIGLALHNYHDVYGCFPAAATTDAAGKPLLSWRVAILPFLEQPGLYNRFKLDEPWNSPHNLALLGERPMVFACPSEPNLGATVTHYLGLVGPGAFFEGTEGTQITSFIDGTSNTLAVVESWSAVPWTAPSDLPFLPRGPLPAMKSQHSGNGFNALFADASVRFLKDSTSPETLRGLITRNASENTDDQSY